MCLNLPQIEKQHVKGLRRVLLVTIDKLDERIGQLFPVGKARQHVEVCGILQIVLAFAERVVCLLLQLKRLGELLGILLGLKTPVTLGLGFLAARPPPPG